MYKFLLALITGIAVGILVAPVNGDKLRRRLSTALNDLTDDTDHEAVI